MLARTDVLVHDHFTMGTDFLSFAVILFVVVLPPKLFADTLKRFYTQKTPGCLHTHRG